MNESHSDPEDIARMMYKFVDVISNTTGASKLDSLDFIICSMLKIMYIESDNESTYVISSFIKCLNLFCEAHDIEMEHHYLNDIDIH